MKYVSEFRNNANIQQLVKEIHIQSKKLSKQINLMEVCGTHTMSIGRYGIRGLLPSSVNLLSGPGCPVCVTSNRYFDIAMTLALQPNVLVATFGDILRVPGSFSTLEKENSKNNNIKVVYSPFECIPLAEKYPNKNILFLGVGFETTSPIVAATLKESKRLKIKNLYILSGHKLILPAMEFILDSGEVKIDGFLCPGHVSAITGSHIYKKISTKYSIPSVVSGFEPTDILQSILMLVASIAGKEKPCVKNQYIRVVKINGNPKAISLISEVFTETNSEWRGLGVIPKSGLSLKKEYIDFDPEKRFTIKIKKPKEDKDCICGSILKGVKTPIECKLFAKKCTPQHPVGPCMVSSEGTCASFYMYEKLN
ncbi:hydrogenase formation protein HypD [bacterium]|nr:hydrogenase formation protein HypD [bacterium]